MIRRFFLSLLLAMMCVAAPVSAAAFDPFGGSTCTGKATQGGSAAAACRTTGGDPISGPGGLLLDITNIVAYFAGAVAVIMIIAGSIKFITSGTDVSTGSRTDTDVEDAKRMIGNALIGLAIIILAKVIISYVIRRLL